MAYTPVLSQRHNQIIISAEAPGINLRGFFYAQRKENNNERKQ